MRCKDSKQHHVMFHELYSVSLRLCIAQNVRFEIPYKVLYFETPFLIIFKCYAWVSCGTSRHSRLETEPIVIVDKPYVQFSVQSLLQVPRWIKLV